MQGHVTTKIYQSGYEPLNLENGSFAKSDVHAILMPSTWGFNPKEVKLKWKPTDILKVIFSWDRASYLRSRERGKCRISDHESK